MKVVKVYGALRERLGQCRFELDVATPAQAIKALCVNFPGLDKWLIDSEQDGVGYRVRVGKQEVTPDDVSVLGLPWSEREVFSITPVVAGAGGGGGSILAGIALVTLAVVTYGSSLAVTGGVLAAKAGLTGFAAAGAALAASAVYAGGFLILRGVAELLSPTPEFGDDSEKLRNFTFSGITNTAQQGLPVPIAYGRVVVGSAVISTGLDVDHSSNSYALGGKLGPMLAGVDFAAGSVGGAIGVKT